MIYALLPQLLHLLLDLFSLARQPTHAKDLEILALGQQLRILQRTQTHRMHPTRWEKLTALPSSRP